MRALVLASLLGALAPSIAAAEGIGTDVATRRPSLGYGDLSLVRGPRVLRHLEVGLGLDVDIIRSPLVVLDGATGARRDVVRTRATGTVLYGVGLLDRVQLTLAVPIVFQSGAGLTALTGDPDDDLPEGAVADLRLDFAWAPLDAPLALGDAALDVGLASGLVAPTGDGAALTGAPGVGGYVDAMAQLSLGVFRAQAELGVRIAPESSLAQAGFGSAFHGAAAVALDLLDRRLVFALSAQVLGGLVSNATFPAQALLETRVVADDERRLVAYVAFGGGLLDEVGSPEWQLVVGFRHRHADPAGHRLGQGTERRGRALP
jgi:hypothetical protein